jgi:F-type H+-transporting ATPase subunit a
MTLLTYLISQADTLLTKQQAAEDNWIIEHISDSKYLHLEPFVHEPVKLPEFPPIHIGGMTIDLSITNKVLMMMIVAGLMIVLFTIAARQNKKNRIPRGWGNMVELIMIFLKDEVVVPSMGKAGLNILPFFFTLFLFILFCNMLGLFPYMSTATGSVSVTAALALVTFVMIQILGIKNNGFIGYFKGLVPPGIPAAVIPIMVIVEFLGLLTKPFALCIRLFANMTAGHIVILALIGLIFTLGYVISPLSIFFSLFIYVLEILIALLQAYIFTMLSALFIGMAVHQEH